MDKHGGETASGYLRPAGESCQEMAGKIASLMLRQRECQRSLEMLTGEQEAFLRDMRSFADAQAKTHLLETDAQANTHVLETGSVLSPEGSSDPAPPESQHEGHIVGSIRSGHRQYSTRRTMTLESCGEADGTLSVQGITMTTVHLKSQLSGLLHTKVNSSMMFDTTVSSVARARAAAEMLQRSKFFEPMMGLVIILNALNIGWTIEMELQNQDTWVQTVIEIVIVGIFWAELMLLFFVQGIRALATLWTIFDFGLNLVTTVVLILMEVEESANFAEAMKQMLILRMLRLLRLFRAVRLIQMSKSLWKLVEGLKNCMGTMVAALVLISILLYVFGCIGAEVITKAFIGDNQVGGLIDTSFSSVPRIMLTLFQFIAMDSTAAIYTTLIHRSPFLFFYFLVLVVLVSIMLMNLITAVIVEDAITTATMDNDMKRHFLRGKLQRLRPAFQELFKSLDTGSHGTLIISDIVDAIHKGVCIPAPIQEIVTPSRMLDLFDLIDQDHSGELEESEFVDGLSCLALSEVPLETMQILHLLRSVRREVMQLGKGRAMDTTHSVQRMVSAAPSVFCRASAQPASCQRGKTVSFNYESGVALDEAPRGKGDEDALEGWEGFKIQEEDGSLTL